MNSEYRKSKLVELKPEIKNGGIPKSLPHFEEANLIITDNPTYLGLAYDTRIFKEYASEFSWLVFKLKEVYEDKIDSLRRYKFYSSIGGYINEAIGQRKGLLETLIYLIDSIKIWVQFQIGKPFSCPCHCLYSLMSHSMPCCENGFIFDK